MATAKTNHLSALSLFTIRPALAEAKLLTAKRACDGVYVATLAEELRRIEGKIAAIEKEKHLGMQGAPQRMSQEPARVQAEGAWNADWIRAKSGELDRRLRCIEHPRHEL
jgi:hypothetical protein